MNFAVIGLVIAIALVLGAVLDGIAKRWHLPFNLMLLLSGFLASEVIVMSGHDTGLRWYHFHGVVSGLLIPLLITVAVTTLFAISGSR